MSLDSRRLAKCPALRLAPCVFCFFWGFAESDSDFVVPSLTASSTTTFYILHNQLANQPSHTSHTMSSLLHIASHIQAAVKAYNSVKEHADREKWKAGFENEKVRPMFKRFIDLIFILISPIRFWHFAKRRRRTPVIRPQLCIR